MVRMRRGFAVIGDTQHLPGYSLLLTDDASVDHVHARYEWEPPDKVGGPVWRYPKELRNDAAHAYSDEKHGELRAAITAELTCLMEVAYAAT